MWLKVARRVALIGIISLIFLLTPILLYRIPPHAIRFDPTYRIIDPAQQESVLAMNSFIRAFKNPGYVPGKYRFILTSHQDPQASANGSYLYLVFPYIAGTSMSVFWNGQFIGSQGDTMRGNSNIWNSAKIFTLPSELFLAQNTLSVEMTNPYEAGFPLEPYILSSAHGAFFISWLRFFSDNLILIIIGALSVLCLIMIISGTKNTIKSNATIYFSLASLCTALFLTDFMTLQILPLPLLEYKRAVAILRHLAAVFSLLGFAAMESEIKNWFNKFFIGVQSLCIILLFLPRTMVDLKNLYSWTFIAITPLPVYLLINLMQPKNRMSSNGFLLGGIIIASILAIRDSLLPIFGISSIFLSHYGFSIMILAVASFIVSEFINQNQRLAIEQIRAARFKEDSMRDPLTGAYNRNIIDEVLSTLGGCFSILVFDLNDLKLINDTYGHLAGDEVLEDLAHILNDCVIENKTIVRTGGDEFLMIMPSLKTEQTDHVISDLQARISKSRIKDSNSQGEFSYSVSIGSASVQNDSPLDYQAFAKLLDEADQRMYMEKEKYQHLRIQ